jgi:hypothetical protein
MRDYPATERCNSVKKLTGTFSSIINYIAFGRPLSCAVIVNKNISLAGLMADSHHKTVIIGSRFMPLYRLTRKISARPGFIAVEIKRNMLPVQQQSLDILVLSDGLPKKTDAVKWLKMLKQYLKPQGIILWSHPCTDSKMGRLGRILMPFRPGIASAKSRAELCRLTMEAGYSEVGQYVTRRRGPFPWAITTGKREMTPF